MLPFQKQKGGACLFDGGPGPLDRNFRWKPYFAAAWVGGAALAAAVVYLAFGGRAYWPEAVAAAAAGAAGAGALLYWFVSRWIFGAADRWRREVLSSSEGMPAEAGLLSPLAAAAAERYRRAWERIEELYATGADRLHEVETLRREIEETRRHLQGKVEELRSLYEVATVVAGTLEVEELFRVVPERVRGVLGLRDLSVFLYDEESRTLRCRAFAGIPEEAAAAAAVRPGEGVLGRVFETGRAVYQPDARLYLEFPQAAGGGRGAGSFMCIPLVSKGRAIGVLNVTHAEPNALDAESMAALRVLAAHLAIAIENARMFQFVKTLAAKDSLTLLYNHGAFHQRLEVELERAARYGRPISVIMLDLDRFKEINDTHGHLVGDRVLVATGGVLAAHLRQSDVPARYGGDEFAVILPETDLAAASSIASRIAAGISQVRVETGEGVSLAFTASIGYASCPSGCRDRRRLLDAADRLMYESKRRGPGGILGEQLG